MCGIEGVYSFKENIEENMPLGYLAESKAIISDTFLLPHGHYIMVVNGNFSELTCYFDYPIHSKTLNSKGTYDSLHRPHDFSNSRKNILWNIITYTDGKSTDRVLFQLKNFLEKNSQH